MCGAQAGMAKRAVYVSTLRVALASTLFAACEPLAGEPDASEADTGSLPVSAPTTDAEATAWEQLRDASDSASGYDGSKQPIAALDAAGAADSEAQGSRERDAAAAFDAGTGAVPDAADAALRPAAQLDPGSGPWVPVARDEVRSVCRLDPDALARADELLGTPWLAVRYGRLCHAYQVDGKAPEEALSAAKFLGAAVTGAVAYQTRALEKRGPKTGPFSDNDRVDAWVDSVDYNRDARVGHVLGMVAQSQDLSPGKRHREYDIIGWVQLDSLGPMLNAAIAQDTARLGADLDVFVKRFFFEPLGMPQSTWSDGIADKAFGWTWATTPSEMARLGLLILRGGVWNGQRILDEEWAYRMTHPAFEDADTGFGYCTWLNASSNYTMGDLPVPESWGDVGEKPHFPGPCAPVSIYRAHPHGLSEAPDCNYDAPYTCAQKYDVGVWQSIAGFGKVIQGHPGLDLVLVGWDVTPLDFFAMPSAGILWDAVKPAVIAADPKYAGDEAGFCAAYGSNQYAPDLR
jgi:hypothetical protein